MRFRFRLVGRDPLTGRFAKLLEGGWKRELLAIAGGLIVRQTTTRIASEKTAPSGAPWAGYAASTLRRKKRGSGLLVDTGRLLGSIHASVGASSVAVGTSVFYGAFHQDGTPKMPARPFLGLSRANEAELDAAIDAFIAKRFA